MAPDTGSTDIEIEMDGGSDEEPTRISVLTMDGHYRQQVWKRPDAPEHSFFMQTRANIAEVRGAIEQNSYQVTGKVHGIGKR